MDAQQTLTSPVETDEIATNSLAPYSVESTRVSTGAAENASLIKNADGFSILGGQFTSAAGNVTVHHHYQHHDPGLASTLPINIMDDSFSESEVFCNQLLRQKRGFPLYVPEPSETLPIEYQECGVQIGDVGTITPEGSFDFFFNVFLPADHPINDDDVPENFQPLSGYRSKDVQALSYEAGSDVSTASVQRIDDSDFPGGDFVFGCRAPQGALLALPHGSRLQKLKNLEPIREYAAVHAESWFKYINGRRGRGLCGALYLVTGCEKSPSWGMASFHSTDEKFDLSFKPITAAGGYKWRGNPAKKKCHNLSGPTHEAAWNQTIFLHGFSVSLGTTIWARIFATVQIREDNTMDSASESTGGNASSSSQGLSLLSRALNFFGGAKITRCNNAGASSHAVLSDLPPIPKAFHPSQLINNYILDKAPQATIVISHDDNWCDILGDNTPGSQVETTAQLLQRISDQYDIIDHEGVTFLHEARPVSEFMPVDDVVDVASKITSVSNKQKAQMDDEPRSGRTRIGNTDTVKLLIDHGADLYAKDWENLGQFKNAEGLELMLLEKQSTGSSTPPIPSANCSYAPISGNAWPSLQSQTTKDVLQSVLNVRKSWKTLRGGETVWPLDLEAALLEGLEYYQPDHSRETRMLGRFPRRNRFISDYIFRKTGKRRSAKQVGSRLQQLRKSCGGKKLLYLLSPSRQPAYSDSSASSDSSCTFPVSPLNGSTAQSARHTVVYIDILPEADGTADADGKAGPVWSDTEDVVHAFDYPRHFSSIDPTVTFVSQDPVVAESRFTVYSEDRVLHAETTQLTPVNDAPVPGFLYSTTLVPEYWGVISESSDPTRFTIYQEVVKNSNSTMVFSATYKFSYPTRHSSGFPHGADFNAKDRDNLDQFKQVEELKLMLLEKQMEALGNDHPDALMSMENLANTYSPDINHGSASEIDSDLPNSGTVSLNSTTYLSLEARRKEAEQKKAILCFKQRDLGDDHPDTLAAMENLAWAHHELGEYKLAGDLRTVLLEKRRVLLGDDDPLTLHSMHMLAATFHALGQFKKAEGLQVMLLERLREALGDNHPDTLCNMRNLADTYQQLGRLTEAESLMLQVLEKRRELLGEAHPDILCTTRDLAVVVISCRSCRGRKIRCDSTRPSCNNCVQRNEGCTYDAVLKRRGPDKRPGTRKRSCKKRPKDGSSPGSGGSSTAMKELQEPSEDTTQESTDLD